MEFWLVGGLVGASMVFTRLLPYALAAALLFWALRWLTPGQHPQRTPSDLAVIVLGLTLPITLWATINPERTLLQVERLLSGIALMVVIVNWGRTTRRLYWLFMGACALGFLIALSAPISVDWATNKVPLLPDFLYERFVHLLPDRVHPNVMGGFLILFGVLPASGILFARKWLKFLGAVPLLIFGGVVAVILVLTQSRGAWIALAAALLALVALRWRWGWAVSTASVVGLAIVYAQFQDVPIIHAAINSVVKSFDGRVDLWTRAIYMIHDFPFTGIGMGNFGEILAGFYPLAVVEGSPLVPHAHQLFLQVAVDLGLPGLVSWLAILLATIVAAWKIYRTPDPSGFFQAYGAGLLCSQVALIAHGLTDSVVWGLVRPAPLVWALWGMIFAGYHAARSSAGPEAERKT